MSAWAAVLLAGVGSYAFRLSMVLVVDRFALPPWFERSSSYVMPAVFAGLVASSLAGVFGSAGGHVATSVPVVAAVATTAATARRRSAPLAVLAGMIALWLTQAVLAITT